MSVVNSGYYLLRYLVNSTATSKSTPQEPGSERFKSGPGGTCNCLAYSYICDYMASPPSMRRDLGFVCSTAVSRGISARQAMERQFALLQVLLNTTAEPQIRVQRMRAAASILRSHVFICSLCRSNTLDKGECSISPLRKHTTCRSFTIWTSSMSTTLKPLFNGQSIFPRGGLTLSSIRLMGCPTIPPSLHSYVGSTIHVRTRPMGRKDVQKTSL